MGTTITGLFCTSQADITCETALATVRSFVFNVGDSRAFAVNAGGLRPLTRDHSLVQELLDAGNITEEEAQEHPQRNVISQGLGAAVELKPDVWPSGCRWTPISSSALTGLRIWCARTSWLRWPRKWKARLRSLTSTLTPHWTQAAATT